MVVNICKRCLCAPQLDGSGMRAPRRPRDSNRGALGEWVATRALHCIGYREFECIYG